MPMWNRGALAIGAMVAVGVVLATFSVFFHRSQGDQSLELWGVAAATRIRHAPQIEAWQLMPAENGAEEATKNAAENAAKKTSESPTETQIAGQVYRIVKRAPLATARGLVHARHALVVDANYDWSAQDNALNNAPSFTHAIHFRADKPSADGSQETILYFDFASGIVCSDRDRRAKLVEKLNLAEQAFLNRELGLSATGGSLPTKREQPEGKSGG
jgi:hypothetical protein